jgi:hypothetical protein
MNYLKSLVFLAALLWSGTLFADSYSKSETVNVADFDQGNGPFDLVFESGADCDGDPVTVDAAIYVTTAYDFFSDGQSNTGYGGAQAYGSVRINGIYYDSGGAWHGWVNNQLIDLGNGDVSYSGNANSSGSGGSLYVDVFPF